MFNCLNRTAKFQSRSQLALTNETEIIQQLTNQELIRAIDGSSFYRKYYLEATDKSLPSNNKHNQSVDMAHSLASLQQIPRSELEQLYARARSYACNSIFRSLYRTDRLRPKEVNHLDHDSRSVSDQTGLPILLIHPDNQTFCRIHDYFDTPELAHPHII